MSMKFILNDNKEWELVPEAKSIPKTIFKVTVIGVTLFALAICIDWFFTGGIITSNASNLFHSSTTLFKTLKTVTLRI